MLISIRKANSLIENSVSGGKRLHNEESETADEDLKDQCNLNGVKASPFNKGGLPRKTFDVTVRLPAGRSL